MDAWLALYWVTAEVCQQCFAQTIRFCCWAFSPYVQQWYIKALDTEALLLNSLCNLLKEA